MLCDCHGPGPAEIAKETGTDFGWTTALIWSQRKQTAMNLKIKMGLLFGFLTLLLIVSASLSYFLVKRIDNDVQNLGRVEAPLIEAVVAMQISIGKGSESIIQYTLDKDSSHLQRFQTTNNTFANALDDYKLLAESDEETEAGVRLQQFQTEFGGLSDEIIKVTDGINSDLTTLGTDITNIQEDLIGQIPLRIDPNTLEGLSKIEAVLSLSIDVDEAFLAVQSYVSDPEPEIRRTLRGKREEFQEVDAPFLAGDLSLQQEDLTGALDSVFQGVVTAGENIMDQVDHQRVLLVQLEIELEGIDRVMGEEIQPLLFAQAARRQIDAEASVDVAILSAFILIALAAVAGVGAAVVVARQIVNPIVRLTNAAVDLGKGDLGVRTDVESRDEIGILASSFKETASARQQGEADLIAAQEEIVRTEKLAVIGQWSGGIAHDLRNPISAITTASSLIKNRLESSGVADVDNRLGECLEIIDDQVVTSNKIITDLMTFVNVGSFPLTETNLGQVLEGSMATMQKNDNVELSRVVDPSLSLVMADGGQLQRVFLNLANNAQDAMPSGGKLTISAKNVNNHVEILFTDTGEGISDENMEKIFDPLFTRKSQGTGLGLAVCQEIVTRHGGTISARRNNEPSGGTIFEVNLPVVAQQPQEEPSNYA